jgi:16S rRNA (uracil1498-N3)-methyltransferase
MLTELGIDEIHVFGQVGVAKDRLSDKVLIRWRRILRQACKQAKRPWLPEVLVHGDVAGMLAKTKGYSKIILDPGASERLDRVVGRCDGPLLLIVGGEKGFSQGELEHLEASGASRGKIGSYVLRAVTAVYGAAVNLAMYRDGISGKS